MLRFHEASKDETRHYRLAVVVVAIEPRSYAEVIGSAIATLRPELPIKVVEPGELGVEVASLDPTLVLCSQPNTFTEGARPCWVEFYPYDEREPIRVNGRCEDMEGVELEDLLSLLDRLVAVL